MKFTIVSPPKNIFHARFQLGDQVRVITGSEAGKIGFIVNMSLISDDDGIEYELDSCDFLVWESELESV